MKTCALEVGDLVRVFLGGSGDRGSTIQVEINVHVTRCGSSFGCFTICGR
jgi:hypothetical protein